MKLDNLAGKIDYACLNMDASTQDIVRVCEQAKNYQFASVCVNPWHIATANKELAGSGVAVGVAVGFPLGAIAAYLKTQEIRDAAEHGTTEFDVVANIGALKSKDFEYVFRELCSIVHQVRDLSTGSYKRTVKIIIEAVLLGPGEIINMCEMVQEAKADFIKTSTGFQDPISVSATHFIRSHLQPSFKLKVAGGIKTVHDAIRMLLAGADRLGTSHGPEIMEQARILIEEEAGTDYEEAD